MNSANTKSINSTIFIVGLEKKEIYKVYIKDNIGIIGLEDKLKMLIKLRYYQLFNQEKFIKEIRKLTSIKVEKI
ncbi:MAG: hypothetical protein RMJ36_05015 [Candidatus Calescibacterium sp.]|nr:hypothetical protein [Candidatus Calescibacterium sp.]MDW8132995.1 hypothetical protein [Candidatus Calescibacterium sp.]